MKKNNDFILDVLNVVSWMIFIWLCVEACALIYKFIYTLLKPMDAPNTYKDLISELYQTQFPHFIGVMSFIVAISLLKAYLFYLVVKIFMKLNLVKPFTIEIAKLIEKISYEAFTIAIVSIIAQQYSKHLIQSGYDIGNMEKHWNDTIAFLMMAAIIFVISQVFKKGIELQNENDLTV